MPSVELVYFRSVFRGMSGEYRYVTKVGVTLDDDFPFNRQVRLTQASAPSPVDPAGPRARPPPHPR